MQLNFTMHDGQLEIYESKARFKVVAAGRRFGKSYYAAMTLLIEALRTKNEYGYDITKKEVWYIAPTFNQAKDILWSLLKSLGEPVIIKTLENTGTIYLKNGRRIQLKGADRPDNMRGPGLSYVVLDEYAFMKPFVWEEIIFPTLTDVKGSALFIGTPEGKNHFYEVYKYGLSDEFEEWESWHFNTIENPFLDKSLVDMAKKTMSTQLYQQEFEASFTASGGNIFHESWLIFNDEEPKDGYYIITLDPAGFTDSEAMTKGNMKRLDDHAIAVVKVNNQGWWVREIEYGKWGARETALRLLKKCKEYQPMSVGIEKGALKNAMTDYLNEYMMRLGIFPVITPLTHGGVHKTKRIIWALQGRFEKGLIQINPGSWTEKFVEQYLDFPNDLTHDDLIDALAYVDQLAKYNNFDISMLPEWFPLDDITGF